MHDDVNIVSTEQKLLFDIRELLIEQNKLLKDMNKVKAENIPEIKIDGLNCTLCGGDHKNIGIRLACAKKNKNKGV